jgi:hypothetical protein
MASSCSDQVGQDATVVLDLLSSSAIWGVLGGVGREALVTEWISVSFGRLNLATDL